MTSTLIGGILHFACNFFLSKVRLKIAVGRRYQKEQFESIFSTKIIPQGDLGG